MAIYFRVLHFGYIFFLFCEILLNACVDNRKGDFWGPCLWPLDIHQYSFPISSENFAAHSRSQCMLPSNLQHQGPQNRPKERKRKSRRKIGLNLNDFALDATILTPSEAATYRHIKRDCWCDMRSGIGRWPGTVAANVAVNARWGPGARSRQALVMIVRVRGWRRRSERSRYCCIKRDRWHETDSSSESRRGREEGYRIRGRRVLLGLCCQCRRWRLSPPPYRGCFMIRGSRRGGGGRERMMTTTRMASALPINEPTAPYTLTPRGRRPWWRRTTMSMLMLTGIDGNCRDLPWRQSPTLPMIVSVGTATIARDMVLSLSCWFSATSKGAELSCELDYTFSFWSWILLWKSLHFVEISMFCGYYHTSRGNIHVPWILSAFRGYICITWILSAFRGSIHVP